jgi:hypothetical protein
MLFPERITQTSNRTYEYVLEKIIAKGMIELPRKQE